MYPKEVIEEACLPNNKSGILISINVLEMVCVILNMAAAIFVCDHDDLDLSKFPILLIYCDNTAACNWVNKHCKHSMIGHWLDHLFVGLLMSTNIGVQAEWILTYLNFANDISHLKTESEEEKIDYVELKITYPILEPCCPFQPSYTLLG